jgi:hypothetical protein
VKKDLKEVDTVEVAVVATEVVEVRGDIKPHL